MLRRVPIALLAALLASGAAAADPQTRDPAKVPANFQKRTFPFRIDGVRAPSLNHLNMNVARTVRLGNSKTMQFRVDALNVFNHETYADPNLNPTSTQFGRITANNGTYMRFVTFVIKFNY